MTEKQIIEKIASWLAENYEAPNRDMGIFFKTEEAAQRYAVKKWTEKLNEIVQN